jgi:hypothetical protein
VKNIFELKMDLLALILVALNPMSIAAGKDALAPVWRHTCTVTRARFIAIVDLVQIMTLDTSYQV